MIPGKLQRGDEIRVIAPSSSLSRVREDICKSALEFLEASGFKVTFSRNSREMDDFLSSSIASRVEDLRDAFLDPAVKMVITCIGGFNVNQILQHIDYTVIQKNPKILCGYSDITALLNAVYARTGLVTYHGPHFSTFGFERDRQYTVQAFVDCLMDDKPVQILPSGAAGSYHVIQKGCCEGTIIGGNLCSLNLLQGTPYMPGVTDKILFIEDDNIMGEYFKYEFDRNLQSLLQVSGGDTVKGIVFGRFHESCGLDAETVKRIIRDKVSPDIPVVFGVDFGHVFPMTTFPVGGTVKLRAQDNTVDIEVNLH